MIIVKSREFRDRLKQIDNAWDEGINQDPGNYRNLAVRAIEALERSER